FVRDAGTWRLALMGSTDDDTLSTGPLTGAGAIGINRTGELVHDYMFPDLGWPIEAFYGGPLAARGPGGANLSGAVAGVGSATGALAASPRLSGTVAGISTAVGALTASPRLSGTTAGVSTLTGTITRPALLSGTTAGVSTATGTLGTTPKV